MQREQISEKFPLGSPLPVFALTATDGRNITQEYFNDAKCALVVFTCNHCPYVKGSEDSLLHTVNEFSGRGLKTVFISSNDADQYPEDGLEKMQQKAIGWRTRFPTLDLPYRDEN